MNIWKTTKVVENSCNEFISDTKISLKFAVVDVCIR